MARGSLFLVFLIGLSACGSLSRHPGSGYSDDFGFAPPTRQDHFATKADFAETNVRSELGLNVDRVLSEAERLQVEWRSRLRRLEETLLSPKERKQYYGLKPYFKDDPERIEFLELPSYEARERFAQARSVGAAEAALPPEITGLVENGDVGLGMTRRAVRESWGDPDFVEIAGDPLYGNERWKYIKYVSNDEGYAQEQRLIYFESGRVAGWETLAGR